MKRLLLGGKAPTEQELLDGDELIRQMVDTALAKGKADALKDIPTKEKIVQTLTVEDVKNLEPVKQMISTATEEAKKSVDKATIIKDLKKEEIEGLEVTQALISESLKKAGFVENIIQAATDGKATITDKGGVKKSIYDLMDEERAALSI
jgi:hypothetical protein